MKTLGSYQNDVEGLDNLDLTDYERIFRIYTVNTDGMDMNFYNILNRIDMPENIDSRYVKFYEAKGNAPWTILAYNIYGSVKMWWLLALMNKDILDENRFVVKGGTQIKYLIPEILGLVYNQITNITVFNGKHY
jgi:hypothetical protein